MPTPIEDEDVVVPLRLQPVVDRPRGWRGRSGSVVAVVLVGFLVTALALGRALDDGRTPPPIAVIATGPAAGATAGATATVSRPPTPSPEPAASPLPAREVIGGRIPDERRLVFANGVQVLDLATGTLEPTTRPLYDHMLPVGADQVVCACSLSGVPIGETPVPPTVRFGRYDLTGRVIVQRDLLSLVGVEAVPEITSGFNLASTLSADRSTLYVLVASRRPPSWSIDVYAVSVETGKILGHALLGRLPVDPAAPTDAGPSPSGSAEAPSDSTPDGIYVWTNALAAAPGGRTLHAVIGYVDLRKGAWNTYDREWMVPLRGGRPGSPIEIKSDGLPTDDWCISAPPEFVDRDLLVETCSSTSGGILDSTYRLRRFASDGTRLEDLPLSGFPVSRDYPMVTSLDRAARVLFIWDPVRHAIGRIDVDTGIVVTNVVPASQLPGLPPTGNPVGIGVDPGLVASPDGTRLYALGMLPNGSTAGRSTGVWAFDARTLEPLGHWPARARLTSLAVSADGTFVYAAGAQGFDTDGNPGSSGASITVYDAATGEIQVLYGSVSPDTWITFPTWP